MLKLKRFSGYAENVLTGVSYQSAQVGNNILTHSEDIINRVDDIPVSNIPPVKKKLRLARMVVMPWKKRSGQYLKDNTKKVKFERKKPKKA